MNYRLLFNLILIICCLNKVHGQGSSSEDLKNQAALNHLMISQDQDQDQAAGTGSSKLVRITGARFTYPLVHKWINDFTKNFPDIQVIIEPRGTSDPVDYDLLIDAYDYPADAKKEGDFFYIARYMILPVANNQSDFAGIYTTKGLTRDLICQLFFHNLLADQEQEIKTPYTVYTRLQKAGAPSVFAHHFGFAQKDIRGKAIAGADEHLLKALLRDSTGITYLPLCLVYDLSSGFVVKGLSVLPVDLNGNNRITEDEKFYNTLNEVIRVMEEKNEKDIKNIPVGYIYISVNTAGTSPETMEFLDWILHQGGNYLHDSGYLFPEPDKTGGEKPDPLARKQKP